MRQLLYISTSVNSAMGDQLFNILASSRRNNAANGLTGLLWTDGQRFLQVLEGTSLELNATFTRIRADSRHRAVVVLHDRVITERTFGQWAMALADDTDERIDTALRSASPEVRGTFEGLITARRAA